MNLWFILIFALAVTFISFVEKKDAPESFDNKLINKALSIPIESQLTSNKYQQGTIKAETESYELLEKQINKEVRRSTNNMPQKAAYILKWKDSNDNVISLSALGLDYKHHFANSFLVGIRPFALENKWLALYTISKIKTYQLDSEQHQVLEMWQNSAQAYMLPRGDCEDHAIILADWLISEGIDARVVGGKYKTSGHAWVVAIIDNKEFILEATSKRVGKTWNHFPLATLAKNYHPDFMFNRTKFWINTNNKISDNYRGKHWVKTSTYTNTYRKTKENLK